MAPIVSLKIDVDTEIGTRIGIPNLLSLLKELQIPATFYYHLAQIILVAPSKEFFVKVFLKNALVQILSRSMASAHY